MYEGIFSVTSDLGLENIETFLESTDFIVSVVPKFETVSRPESFSGSLLPEYLWNQMNEIEEVSSYQIDGFYFEPKEGETPYVIIDERGCSVSVPHFSCSGLYDLILIPTDNNQVSFESAVIPLSIYPNLYNSYSDLIKEDGSMEMSFNINGISLSNKIIEGGYDYVINYPIMDYGEDIGSQIFYYDRLDSSVVYTPGLYLTGENDALYIWIDYKEENIKNNSNAIKAYSDSSDPGDNYQKYNGRLDLTGLGDADSNRNADIYVYVTKNGSSTPYNSETGKTDQPISLVISNTEVPTGIMKVDAEVCPRYYNLQGMEVKNPSTGIYLRQSGSKIEKVLIR